MQPFNTTNNMAAKIYAKLAAIQAALKAPKGQYNKFGNYYYRKAEDILEAVKPLLAKEGCLLNCTDELLLIGDRYYIKATAVITCIEDGSQILTTAFAREEEEKKGMDGSQVTGASSSYARKYALNGLLCIDDTADSDTTNVGDSTNTQAGPKPTAGRRAVKPKTEAPAPAPAPAPAAPVADTKKPAPARGSEAWNKWVKAIACNLPSKTGEKKDWFEEFKRTYHWDIDLLDVLEADVFNYRMDTGERGQA